MAFDANNILQALVTKTATFQSAGFDSKTGTPPRGMAARFLINSLISSATAGTVFTLAIEVSSDNTTFWQIAAASPITGTTVAQTFEKFIRFSTKRQYWRPVVNVTAAAGAPSIAYSVDLGLSEP